MARNGPHWQIALGVFGDEDGAQAAVDELGEEFVERAAKGRRHLSHRKREDAVVLVVGEDGGLTVSDASRVAHRSVTGVLSGLVVRFTLGFTASGTIITMLAGHAAADSHRRSGRDYEHSDHPDVLDALDRLAPGAAVLLVRCDEAQLTGVVGGLGTAGAVATWSAGEVDIQAALDELDDGDDG